ncbi:MAG: glycosyltransferase [Planctomycetaceae bacterium]|nr:glycosyltransferase [Planctomycetaceae bacterium]
MKLLFISTIFPDSRHPSRGTFNDELCRALKRTGVDVRVIAPQSWTETMTSPNVRFSPAESTAKAGLPVCFPKYWFPPKIMRSQYGQFYWKSIQSALEQTLSGWTPDFILTYWAHPDGEAGLRLAEEINKPCGVIIGGSDVLLLPGDSSRRRQIVRVLQESDLVLTVSQGLAQVVQGFDVPSSRVSTLYQGVDADHFRPDKRDQARSWLGMDPDRPMILWVGRMVDVKNLDMLIKVAEVKANRGDDFVLCLVGDGPLRPQLERTVQKLGLESIVSFVGSVGHQDLPTWYQAADVTVLCSHSEGLPNVFRESLACGTPFVSTDVGSITEIANPQYSMLVEAGNVPAFIQAIDFVMQGPHQDNAAHSPIRTWDDMAADLLELVQALPPGHHAKTSGQNAWSASGSQS